VSLRGATLLYERWHQSPPKGTVPLRASFAATYGWAGSGGEIIYHSTKWSDQSDYHHEWNTYCECWTAASRDGTRLRSDGLPVELAALGWITGYSYVDGSDHEVVRTFGAGKRGPLLAAVGRSVICLVPKRGTVIPVVWTGVRVTERGLVNARGFGV
jgi:hypothetical protein